MLTCDAFLTNGRHFRVPDAEFLTNGMHYRPHFWRTVAIFGFPMASAMATSDFPPNGLHFPPRLYPPVGLAGNVSEMIRFQTLLYTVLIGHRKPANQLTQKLS